VQLPMQVRQVTSTFHNVPSHPTESWRKSPNNRKPKTTLAIVSS